MSILHARRRSCAASSLLLRGLGFTLVLFAFLALAADGVAHASEPATSATASLGLTTGEAIRAILGLLAVAALAYIAGRPFVRRFERSLGLSPLVAFGVPFLLLGLASAASARCSSSASGGRASPSDSASISDSSKTSRASSSRPSSS
jgi:hypothetical protein